MLKIGLTGGIGSGKSTACGFFEKLQVPIIDSDIIARDLVRPGQPAQEQIIGVFGNDIINTMGELDRIKLRDLVFNDSDKRQQLEAILHPAIQQEIQLNLITITASYCIIVIPLLIEVGWHNLVNRILVIDSPPGTTISARRTTNWIFPDPNQSHHGDPGGSKNSTHGRRRHHL